MIAASGAAEVGSAGLSTFVSALGVLAGTGSIVSGTVNVAAGLSGSDDLSNAANLVTAVTSPVGIAVTLATGNYNYGAVAAGLTDSVVSLTGYASLLTSTGPVTNIGMANTLAQPYLSAASTLVTTGGLPSDATSGAPVQVYTPPIQVVDQAPQVEPVPSPSGDLGGGGSGDIVCTVPGSCTQPMDSN